MPYEYFQKPVSVEALRFNGWTEIPHINKWLADLEPLFIPAGYEHIMRLTHENDRSTGNTLESAPPFLVLTEGNVKTRVDVRHWIVRFPDKRIEIHDEASFNKIFDKQEETLKTK